MKIFRLISLLFLLSFLIATIPASASNRSTTPPSHEETLFARRIARLWEDKESRPYVKGQIVTFMEQYPKSQFLDNFLIMLGDLCFAENEWQQAFDLYNRIEKDLNTVPMLDKRFYCLYKLRYYKVLCEELEPHLNHDYKDLSDELRERWQMILADAFFQQGIENSTNNQSRQFLTKAQIYYKSLLKSPLRERALLQLARIYASLDEPRKAVKIYINLAAIQPEQRNALLLEAAKVQATYDIYSALSTIATVNGSQGTFSETAVLQKAKLLFDIKAYEQLLSIQDELLRDISDVHRQELLILLGKSALTLKKFQEAIAILFPVLDTMAPDSPYRKSTLLTLIAAHRGLHDIKAVEKYVSVLENNFAGDEAVAHGRFMQALCYDKAQRFEDCQNLLQSIIEEFPSFTRMESVALTSHRVLYQQQQWPQCRKGLSIFIHRWPKSPHVREAKTLFIQAFLQEYEKEPENTNHDPQFLAELDAVLNVMKDDQIPHNEEYLLRLAQILYQRQHYTKALEVLEDHPFSQQERCSQKHLLIALCHKNGFNDLSSFIHHAEKALQLNPSLPEKNNVHLNLFAAYIKLSEDDNTKNFQDEAARHLCAVVVDDSSIVTVDNILWLANTYYDKIATKINPYNPQTFNNDDLTIVKQAATVFQKALRFDSLNTLLEINENTLFMETAALKLTTLWGILEQYPQQLFLLQQLDKQQRQNSSWPWKHRLETLYALAQAWTTNHDIPQAISFYKLLVNNNLRCNTQLRCATQLHLARLLFDNLPLNERSLDNPTIKDSLDILHKLQMRKSLPQEPIHLEAALDYAFIRASLEPKERQNQELLSLLRKAKEFFTATDDILSKDYMANQELHPEKKRLFQAYLMLFDAHIARLQAFLANKEQQQQQVEIQMNAAMTIYETLLKDHFAVSKYLVDQAKSGLDAMRWICAEEKNMFSDIKRVH